jgi:hypothetical protein
MEVAMEHECLVGWQNTMDSKVPTRVQLLEFLRKLEAIVVVDVDGHEMILDGHIDIPDWLIRLWDSHKQGASHGT